MCKEFVRAPTECELVHHDGFEQYQLVLGDTSVRPPEEFISTVKLRTETPYKGVQLSFFNEEKEKHYVKNKISA